MGLDKCIVYRTKAKGQGKDKNAKIKGEGQNIHEAGEIADLIMTYRPPAKFFSPGEALDGKYSSDFMARSRYCIEAITSKWSTKGGTVPLYRSMPKDESFSHFKLEGALMARFEDPDLRITMVSNDRMKKIDKVKKMKIGSYKK